MRRASLFIAVGLSLLPATASAERSVDVPVDNLWTLQNVQVREVSGQPVLVFGKDGIIERPVTNTLSIHDVTAHLQVPEQTTVQFLWHALGDPAGSFNVYTFSARPGETEQAIPAVDLPDWDARTDRIGLSLPDGGVVYFTGLSLTEYTFMERWMHEVRSFWSFDSFGAHSINFLWGPLLAKSDSGLAELYDHFPPYAHSANRWVYGLIVLSIVGFAVAAWIRDKRIVTGALVGLLVGSSLMWLLLDARMGAELLSYARNDWDTYVQRPVAERSLRGTYDLYGLLESAQPYARGQAEVALLVPKGIPAFSYAQYLLSPAHPVQNAPYPEEITTWIVFHRPDVRSESGTLVLADGTVLAHGKEVVRTSDSSFVFHEE